MNFLTNWYSHLLEKMHRKWLSQYDPRHARLWEKDLNNDREAALCEVQVRRVLQKVGATVRPNPASIGHSPAPDFLCTIGESQVFVEVACVTSKTMTKRTHLPEVPNKKLSGFTMTGFLDAMIQKCKKKKDQCQSDQLPTLLAIGTFHPLGSCIVVRKFNMDLVLSDEAFLSCPTISGVIAFGFGVKRIPRLGVLHPHPTIPFNPTLLPSIEFWCSRPNE